MKNILLGLTVLLLFTAPAFAQKIPDPVTVAGMTFPGEVGAEIQRNTIVCQRVFSQFSIDPQYITKRDITDDGMEDYVLTTRGYLCNGQHNEFKNVNGDTYTFFIGQKNGTYAKHVMPKLAYEMQIDDSFRPPFLIFTVPCDRQPNIDRYGEVRVRLETNRMEVRNTGGCKSKRHNHNNPVITPVTPPVAVPAPSVRPPSTHAPTRRGAAPVGELEELEGAFDDNTGIP